MDRNIVSVVRAMGSEAGTHQATGGGEVSKVSRESAKTPWEAWL
jgi:hypothetical protein